MWPTDIADQAESIMSNGGVPLTLLDEMESADPPSGGKVWQNTSRTKPELGRRYIRR
jgi:hypothetical protein